MDAVQSIFSQMRRSREALNESVEEVVKEEEVEVINESEETSEVIDEAEEFVVIKCHDCGAILSALDEAEAGCPVCGSEDLDEKTVKVVKDGKVVTKNVSTRKKKLSPAQKAALAKARKKAHSAGANKKRAKSNKIRAAKGMNEGDLITCPECDFEGEYDEYDVEDGVLICPECGAEVEDTAGFEEE